MMEILKIIKDREDQKEKLIKNMDELGLNKIYFYKKLFDTITLITTDDIKKWDVQTRDTKDYVNYMTKGIYLSNEQIEYIINNLKNNNIEYVNLSHLKLLCNF